MSQARGTGATFALYEESTYGAAPGTPDGKKLYLSSFGLALQQNRTASNVLSGERSRTEPYLGNKSVQGNLATEIGAENLPWLLKHALGAVATTGSGPYTHVLTIANSLPTGLTLEVDYGAAISGSGRYVSYNGCRVNQMTLSFPQEGACTASFDLMGAKAVAGSAALDATLTDTGHTTYSAFSSTIQEGGSAIATVRSAEIVLANDLDGQGYVIGGGGELGQLPEGFASISGTLTVLFSSAALMNKALSDTASSLAITLARGDGLGSAGNESMLFEVEQLKYEPSTPAVEGPAGVVQTLKFQGYRSGSAKGLKITVKNAVASY
jgi:hypothetical protein